MLGRSVVVELAPPPTVVPSGSGGRDAAPAAGVDGGVGAGEERSRVEVVGEGVAREVGVVGVERLVGSKIKMGRAGGGAER